MSTLIPAPNKRRQNHLAALRRISINTQNNSSPAVISSVNYNYNSNSRLFLSSNGNLNCNKNNSDFCQVTNLGNIIPVWEGNEELSTVSYTNEWLEKSNKSKLSYQYVGSDNKELYNRCVKNVAMSAMEGLNGVENQPGIIPLTVDDVFFYIKEMFLLRVSYMEIYNEQIQDLLSSETTNLRNFKDRRRGIYVSPLKEEIVTYAKQVMRIIQKGETNRHISTTDYNKYSSLRVSRYQLDHQKGSTDSVKISQLNLIDLSGSEKATLDADCRKEGAFINKSLLTLGNVISKLTKEKRGHIPYRDSKLTRILQSSISGNAKISVICTISPAGISADESHNTLNFAKRVLDNKALIQKYKKEINELKIKLQVATDMSNISTIASLEDGKKDKELMLLQQERIKWEEEMHEQQLLRTALKECIDNLTKLILTSSSISLQMLEFSKTSTKNADGNKASLLSLLNISENELPPYIEEVLSKQTGQLEKLQKEAKNLALENEKKKKKILEDLTKKNKDLETCFDFNDNNVNLNTPGLSFEVESLLEDQQHLELLEEENKQLRKALNQSEIKLKKLELIQLEDIEKPILKTCGNNNNIINTNTNNINTSKNVINMENPVSPTKRRQSLTIYSNISNSINSNNESINIEDKENYYTMIIQELQASLEKERKKYQEEMKKSKEQLDILQNQVSMS
ncbi:kinesin-domain-containing protein [Neocallimastix lanati (nom. inval.)]|nr:kinesin-domain-containing protein [Neocallimastix sp. JGI-2020a]